MSNPTGARYVLHQLDGRDLVADLQRALAETLRRIHAADRLLEEAVARHPVLYDDLVHVRAALWTDGRGQHRPETHEHRPGGQAT